ncbi:MAG: hypothetical protein U0350_15930 [Caldilineaceae bacterium]
MCLDHYRWRQCWGYNSNGQLGNGATTTGLTPINVTGLISNVLSIASANSGHTCALLTGGAVKCWGYNGYGQLGDGATTDRVTPVSVTVYQAA